MGKLVVGLGNPGQRYADTRHNIGWRVLDEFARKHQLSIDRRGYEGVYGELTWAPTGEKVLLLKPLTYVNLSGRSVAAVIRYYKLEPPDVFVIYDDMDLTAGRLRLREKGSSGGHNGIKSVIEHLQSQEFPRMKIGVGRPAPGWEVPDWVLSRFGPDELPVVTQAVDRAVNAVEEYLTAGIVKAMTQFNGM